MRLIKSHSRSTSASTRRPPKGSTRLASFFPNLLVSLFCWLASSPYNALSQSQNHSPRLHWAYRPPSLPAIPRVDRPSWIQTPVDAFILKQLETVRLSPSPQADRRTLIRRATLDLLGLPPNPLEVQHFLTDPAPDAFARLIDRLLASPRYGERWGRFWLDVARYADTKGYVYYYEESRFVHPHTYRDWVIQAFNSDLPYNRFLELQIAADLVDPTPTAQLSSQTYGVSTVRWPPESRPPSHAALGFLALGRRFLDLAPDIIVDQIDVVMRGTQGITASCARCHDHKFDPFPTTDYYALYGIFQGSAERVVSLEPPPSPDQLMPFGKAKARVEFEAGLKDHVERLEQAFKTAVDQVALRLRSKTKDYLVAVLDVAKLPSDANVRPQPEDINPFNVRQWERYIALHAHPTDPVFGAWHAFSGLPADDFPTRSRALCAEWSERPVPSWLPSVSKALRTPPMSMVEVAQRYADLLVDAHSHWQNLLSQSKSPPQRLPDADAELLRQVLYGPDSPVLPPRGQITDLDVHLYFDDPNRVALTQKQMALAQHILSSPGAPPHAVIVEDRPETVDAVVFRRGDPLKPGERVPRGAPTLIQTSAAASSNPTPGSRRRDLAQAITDPRNPLTARVMVNRVWAHHFGTGLVPTVSDFGTRTEPPSHPELLDWLAIRFMEGGWSIKQLHRLLMNSAVYQQGSAVVAASDKTDPDNKLLSRFPSQPLSIEAFRDSLLAVAGGLDARMGGPASRVHTPPYSHRRTVYAEIDRRSVPSLFRVFNFTNPDLHTPKRHANTTAQQALFLMNHPFIEERARALASSLDAWPPTAVAPRIQSLFNQLFQRAPSASELSQITDFIRTTPQVHVEQPISPPNPTNDTSTASRPLTPWEQLCQILLLSNEFMVLN